MRRWRHGTATSTFTAAGHDYFGDITEWLSWGGLGAPFLFSAALALFFSWRIDVNVFAFHMFYRNRLVRCYLGASNPRRANHPFTGFDGDDSVAMQNLRQRPYHLVNAALNITRGTRLAWQERKAASFVASPMFCGYELKDDDGSRRRELPAHGAVPRRRERGAGAPPDEGLDAAERRAWRRSGSRGAQAGARDRAGRLRSGGEPQPGIPFRSRGCVPDDRLQRAPRVVAPEPGSASAVAAHGPALGDHVPPVGAPGHGGRLLQVRVPERRRPLREPRHLRAGAASLPVHRGLRRGHGPGLRVRGPRQCHSQVPGRPGRHDRPRHPTDPARPLDPARPGSLRGRHHSLRADRQAVGRRQGGGGRLSPLHQALHHRERAERRPPVPGRSRRVPSREHVGPVVRRVTVRELPEARPPHHASRVRRRGHRRRRGDRPPRRVRRGSGCSWPSRSAGIRRAPR